MNEVFGNAKIIDPGNSRVFQGTVVVRDGLIADVVEGALDVGVTVDCGGHFLAPGIVDIGVKVCEPGERHKESFGYSRDETLVMVSAKGNPK